MEFDDEDDSTGQTSSKKEIKVTINPNFKTDQEANL